MSDQTLPATAPVCWDRKQAAVVSGMSVSWLRLQDKRGAGPPRLRMGNRIKYPVVAYLAWLKTHAEQ